MTECNSCGGCCNPITLGMTQIEVMHIPASRLNPETRRWILEDLQPMTRKEARRRAPWLFERQTTADPTDPTAMVFYYACRHFDDETYRCRNYDGRPPTCRDYPWPDGIPLPGACLPPACSFNADIGVPVAMLPPRVSSSS